MQHLTQKMKKWLVNLGILTKSGGGNIIQVMDKIFLSNKKIFYYLFKIFLLHLKSEIV